jgi:alkylation response protein AidB-like acyl-CoA dehydrogenase
MRNGRPAIEDSGIRQRLAEIEGYVRTSETSNLLQFTAAHRGEMLPAMRPMMMNKVISTDTTQRIMKCAYDLLGADGLLAPRDEELNTWSRTTTPTGWVLQYIFSMGPAIAGGATNIQLNIIGERGYGLPRDLQKPS